MKKQLIFILLILMLIAGLIQSCKVSEQKKIDKAKIVALNHPNEFAQICAQLFPVRESFIKGKDSIVRDTLYEEKVVKVPVVVKGDTIFVDAKCPKTKTLTNTVYRTDTLFKENTAKLKALENLYNKRGDELNKTKTLLTEAKLSSGQKNWVIGGLAFLFFGAFFLWIRKRN